MPPVLLFSTVGTVTTVALAIMVLFHAHIFSTFPMGVPQEWNVFLVYSALFLFGHYSGIGFGDASAPVLVALLAARWSPSSRSGTRRRGSSRSCPRCGTTPATGRPVCGASGMVPRTCSTRTSVRRALVRITQLSKLYGPEVADLLLYKGLAWRAMHTHGRALMGLLPRAVPDLDAYVIREGEAVAGMVLGWNFGDGHLHDESLLRAVQERCGYADGDLRVVILESQPIHRQRQHYRIVDAATGLIEEGYVDVADMAVRQPWLDSDDPDGDGTLPVHGVRPGPTVVAVNR